MSARFTPGPWRVADGPNDERRVGYLVVAACSKMHGGGPSIVTARPAYRSLEANNEARANAYLIAAAPALYAVLQSAAEEGEQYDGNDWASFSEEARAVLKQARSEL